MRPVAYTILIFFFLIGFANSGFSQSYTSPKFASKLPDFDGLSPLDTEIGEQVTRELIEWALNAETDVSPVSRGKAMAIAWATAPKEMRIDVIKTDFYIRTGLRPTEEWFFKKPLTRERRVKAAELLLSLAQLLQEQNAHQNMNLSRYLYDLIGEEPSDVDYKIKSIDGLASTGGKPSWDEIFSEMELSSVEMAGASSANVTTTTGKAAPFTNRQALIKGLLVAQLRGSDYAGEASQMNATVTDLTASREPTEIVFNQEVGKQMSSALREVEKFLTVRHGSLPPGKRIEISFEEQYSSKDGPSAAVACSLLLNSLITGKEIDSKFAVTGDLNADGTVQKVGGIDGKIRGATRKSCTHVAIPSKNIDNLIDMLVIGDEDALAKIQVFSIATFEEALALSSDPSERDSKINTAIETFAEVQTVLNKPDGMRWLANGHVQERLQSVVDNAPNHQSARLLLQKGLGQIPDKLTLRGSFEQIDRVTKPIWTVLDTGDLMANADGLWDSASGLRRIRNILDPRTKACADALEDLSSILKEFSTNDFASSSPRYKLLRQELNQALQEIRTEYNSIASDPDIQEELLD